jgi:hypothetical protein
MKTIYFTAKESKKYTVTCRPITRKQVDKHVSVEIDSWKLTRYGTHFHGYEWSRNISLHTDRLYKRPFRSQWRQPRVEAGSNTSTVGGDEMEPNIWGCNWGTLFRGDINKGTWPSRLGESRIWDSKICSWVPRNSDLIIAELAKASSNCKRQTHPLVREDVT